ncbi:MAG TPA: hypothetical protein VKU60_10930, partial [Chloroflexota bacterium]|nr:hypothetical protein [Chloroflexota bacterium]
NPNDPQVLATYDGYHKMLLTDPTPDPQNMLPVLDALKALDSTRYGSLSPDQIVDTSFTTTLRNDGFMKSLGIQ